MEMLRNRRSEIETELTSLRARIAPLREEHHKITSAIHAINGTMIQATGGEASMRSIDHKRRAANPDIQSLTFKQLVIKALTEHLTNGATALELLAFFRREWGRDLMRTSLSPQLSRLKHDRKIELRGKVWHLARNENEPLLGFPPSGSETALDAQAKEATE